MQSTTSYSLTVSYERPQTKTKQLHHYFSTYARNTLCLPRFPFSIHPTLLQYCSKLPSSIATKLQIRSDRTVRLSTLSFDFQQTDLTDSTGVGISTRCFYLNHHNFFLSFIFSSHQLRQQRLIISFTAFQRMIDFL